MAHFLDTLNDVQRAAAEATEGPVLVVAGPGSGKTRVLTFRIANLIEKGVPPWEILALTFTNKAAREMKHRIEDVVGPRAQRVWAGTFHSIFARILRMEAEQIGYPSNFTIYDSDDSKSLLNTIVKEMNLSKDVYKANGLLSRISSAKSSLITPKLYENDVELRQQDIMSKRPHLSKIYTTYVQRCKRSGAMDFDDLLYRLYELFQKNPNGVLDQYRERFKYVLVDEFQDTNTLQYAIIRKLVAYPNSPRNICVVGDDAQSIYAFRGATIQNILDFEEDFKPHGIQVFKLEQNYRSTEAIVQAANEVIKNNRRQIQKKIWSHKGQGQKIKVVKAVSDNEEGKRVADTIVEQKNRFHLSNKDIAILYRTNSQSRIFEEYLRRYNVPYKVFGGLSFYQRKEVKDMIAYLRLVVNPLDEEALRRVLNYPKRGIGKTSLDKLSDLASQANKPMWECLPDLPASTRAKNSIADFRTLIRDAKGLAQSEDAFKVANYLAKGSKLMETLRADTTIEGINRVENLNALLDGIQSFVEEDTVEEGGTITDKSLASYLQNIALLTDFDNENNDGDFVSLMSVHSAKGLEFKSVFVVGLEEKLFPSGMAMDTPEGLDEERRLFYVAITRAEQLLTLTFANSRYRFGQMKFNQQSRFLEELPYQYIDSTSAIRTSRPADSGPSRSGVRGNFTRRSPTRVAVDLSNFKPSPLKEIQPGKEVLHQKFGKGKILRIDGSAANLIATIRFEALTENPDRKLMLKFAKLQVLN